MGEYDQLSAIVAVAPAVDDEGSHDCCSGCGCNTKGPKMVDAEVGVAVVEEMQLLWRSLGDWLVYDHERSKRKTQWPRPRRGC